jgi:hypothetical protein
MSLHTTGGCSMDGGERRQSGTSLEGNCDIGSDGNAGCGVTGDPGTYGVGFNGGGGGVSLYHLFHYICFYSSVYAYLIYRCMRWNCVTQAFGSGISLVPRFHRISTMDHLRILRPGEYRWPISPVQTVILGLISGI